MMLTVNPREWIVRHNARVVHTTRFAEAVHLLVPVPQRGRRPERLTHHDIETERRRRGK